MKIQSMFHEEIDRPINGVVKVDQDERDVLVQELREYVITSAAVDAAKAMAKRVLFFQPRP